MKPKLLGILCFAELGLILTLGLWPFHSPQNEVTWLKRTNGLAFGEYGTVVNSGALKPAGSRRDISGSVEVWLQPDRWSGSATFLALYRPQRGLLFRLRQSLTDLELQAEFQSGPEATRPQATRKAHFYADDAFSHTFRQKKPVVITVTSSLQGTTVYLDGTLAKREPRFWIPEGAFMGRLVVGDSPRQPDGFRGQIRGLAIYDAELSGAQVLLHYRTWTERGRPDVAPDERNIALYLFDEHTGNVIHNHAAAGGDLTIPETYAVIDKISLEPFWKEFTFYTSYWKGNLKNIVGFIPVGFCFYAYFTVGRPIKRAPLVTVVLGALMSLTIEVLQAFLPTRDSGTTDLVTNTLGTYVGVMCYGNLYPVLVEKYPRLGWFTAPRP